MSDTHTDVVEAPAEKPAAKARVTKVKYVGPPAQTCSVLSQHGFSAKCELEKVYELPSKVAHKLVKSIRHFVLDTE